MPWESANHQLVAHGDMIYIIGGSNNTGRVAYMTQYDVRRDRYTLLPSMFYAKSNFAAVVLEGCIYAIAGYDGWFSMQEVERYDIAAQKWYLAPPDQHQVLCVRCLRCSEHRQPCRLDRTIRRL
ncbi:hypothetical protein MTO96_035994 [Rhipicephalus appendiculatus]